MFSILKIFGIGPNHKYSNLSIRKRVLDPKTGQLGYKSFQFNEYVRDILAKSNFKPYIQEEGTAIRVHYKQVHDEVENNDNDHNATRDNDGEEEEDICHFSNLKI